MKIEIVFVSHRTNDTEPCFIINAEDGSYIFNVPDGSQRVFMEKKYKVSKIKSVFLSSNDENSTGGLLGMIFTMLCVENFVPPKICGPDCIKDQLMTNIAYKNAPEILPEILESYQDEFIKVNRIQLSKTVAFDIKMCDYPGKFMPNKAKQLGIPAGPLFKKLVAGESITLDDGRVIQASDCVGESTPGDNILVIDARSIDDLKCIDISKYNTVIHLSCNDLLVNNDYVQFFSNIKNNFAFCTNNSVVYRTVYDKYQECSKLYPEFLKRLSSSMNSFILPNLYTIISESDIYTIAPLDKKKLYPAKKITCEEVNGEYPQFETFGVTFLGTGARQPLKMRNVTGLVVHTKTGVIAVDPGEDYVGQLRRKYGREVAERLMKEIKMIFITHIHGDHNYGVHKLLSERSKVSDEEIILQADQDLIDEIKFFEKDRKFNVKYVNREVSSVNVGNNVVHSIPTSHCPGSHAILIDIDGKYRFSFTGDKNQKDEFISTVGKCDFLVHEATYDDDKAEKADSVGHSTIGEAVAAGKKLGAKTALTHISGRYSKGLNSPDNDCFFVFDYLFVPFEKINEINVVCDKMNSLLSSEEE